MSRQNQKEKLNIAIFDYLKRNYPDTANIFFEEAKLTSTIGIALSSLDCSSSFASSKYLSKYKIEGGDKVEEGLLEKRWAATSRMQIKILEQEKQINQLNEKLSLFQNTSKHHSDFDGLPTGPPLMSLVGHRKSVNKIVFHPLFQIIASASDDTTIKIWNYENEGRLEKSLNDHTDGVNDLIFDASGKWLLSASSDTTIKYWDFLNYECKRTFRGHDATVSCVRFASNESFILSSSKDKTVKLWEISTGFCLRTYTENDDWIRCVSCHFLPTVKLFAFCGNDKKIHLWNLEEGCAISEMNQHTHVVEYISFGTYELMQHLIDNAKAPSPLPKHLTDMSKKSLNVKNGSVSSPIITTSTNSSLQKDEILKKCGVVIISASRDRTIKLWDAFNATLIQNYVGHENWVREVIVHTQGKHFISCSDDKSIRIWDVLSGRCIKAITNAHSQFVTCIHFNNTLSLLASGSLDCKLNIWSCRKESLPMKNEKH